MFDFRTYADDVVDMEPKESVPTACIATITPEMASEMLANSIGNRSLKKQKIVTLARDIQAGNFVLNGESIIISDSGLLMDGHHRLTACVKAGVPIQSVVVRGVVRSRMKTLDMGSVRGISDHLQIDGYANSRRLAATINNLVGMRSGDVKHATVTSTEAYNFVDRYPSVVVAASKASNVKVHRIDTCLSTIYFVASLNGETEKAEDFIRVFRTGIPAYEDCPAHRLRERIIYEHGLNRKTDYNDMKRLSYRCWEAFRVGEKLRQLKVPKHSFLTGWTVKTS